jgi:hypothetical protein
MSSINQKFCWDAGATLGGKKKHKEEAKLQNPEPLAHTKLLHAMLQWENRRATALQDTGSKPAWETQTNRRANKWHVVLPQLPLG